MKVFSNDIGNLSQSIFSWSLNMVTTTHRMLACPPRLVVSCDSLTHHLSTLPSLESTKYLQTIVSAAITSLKNGSSCGSYDEGHVQVVKYYMKASEVYVEGSGDGWQKQVGLKIWVLGR